jgi:hypothetical protein
MSIPPDDLLTLYCCMLLEKKLILVASDLTYQTQLALIIEGLLILFAPLDSNVYTNISFAVSPDMVMYMDKPGSLLMGMSESLWRQHGQPYWSKHSYDPFTVIFHVEERLFMTKDEFGQVLSTKDQTMPPIGLPSPFLGMMKQTLESIPKPEVG